MRVRVYARFEPAAAYSYRRSPCAARRAIHRPSVMEPCRIIRPASEGAAPMQLPEVKNLVCDESGRNCKFRSE